MHGMNNIKLTQPEIRLHKNNANGEGIEVEHHYNSNVYRADVLKSREGLLNTFYNGIEYQEEYVNKNRRRRLCIIM